MFGMAPPTQGRSRDGPLGEVSHRAGPGPPPWVRMSVEARPTQAIPLMLRVQGAVGPAREGREARRHCFQKKALKETSAGWGLVAIETPPNYLPNWCMRH